MDNDNIKYGIAILGIIVILFFGNGCAGGLCYSTGDCDDMDITICGDYEQGLLNCDECHLFDDSFDVYVKLPTEDESARIGFACMHEIKNGEIINDHFLLFLEQGEHEEKYKFFKESGYFEIDGFYYNDVRVMDGDGIVINEKELKNAVKNWRVDLTLKSTEKKLGEKILVKFTSEHTELVMNPVMVTNGEIIDFFPTPELAGKTFLGWREAGSEKAPVMIKSGDEFHLYLADAGLENTITLEPVFGAN